MEQHRTKQHTCLVLLDITQTSVMPQISHFSQFEGAVYICRIYSCISEGAVEMQTELYNFIRDNDSFTILIKNTV